MLLLLPQEGEIEDRGEAALHHPDRVLTVPLAVLLWFSTWAYVSTFTNALLVFMSSCSDLANKS